MVPEAFVRLEDLPLTINGKVDLGALPTPDRLGVAPGGSVVAAERAVAASCLVADVCRLWEQVLQAPHVQDDDSFFDVGGTSVTVVAVHASLVETFQVPRLELIDL